MALKVYAALVALSLALVPSSQADCTLYCATNDILSTTTCTASASVVVTYECKTGYSSNSGGPCIASPCFQGGTFCSSDSGASNGGECATGGWKAAGGGCSNPAHTGCLPYCSGGPMGYQSYCYANGASSRCYATTVAEVACPSGTLSADESTCTSNTPVQIVYSCADSRYSLYPNSASPTACRRTYPAFTIVSQATCTAYAPSTNGCQWCAGINVCVATTTTPTCPATCPDAVQATCTISISLCQWCDAAISIGVCQRKTEACYSNCTAATASQQQECSKSSECQWCPTTTSIGVCQPNSGTCWPTCTPASDDPLGTGVCRISLDCKWCPTLNYCTEQTRDCHTLCTTVAPDEPGICQVQSIQAQCQWCGAPGSVEYCVSRTDEARLRCAASCGGLIWRQDVCNGALECHWCGVHNAAQGGRCKPLRGKSRGYVAWRREVECETGSESHSSSFSRSASVTSSQTRSGEGSVSDTNTATGSRSMSATNSLSTTASSASQSGGTESVTRTLSGSVTSASMSISYHLPPCNASHLETLAYVWPQLFNFTTNYSAVRQVGFPSILLTGDVRDPGLIYRVPQLLRREVLYHARPMYVTPVPYETPNVDGFVGRADTAPIALRWVSRTTLEVTMAPIGDYWLDTGERITIDVPFEEIELCNRTSPVSLYVPPTLQLVGVDIEGPRVDTTATTGVEVVSAIAALASFITGDASSAGSIQTMVMLGMSPCSQPTSKQTLSNLRALGPLPIGIDGYVGVVVGNIVIAVSVALLQCGLVRGLLVAKRASSAFQACEIVRAPSMTIAAFFSFYQGTFYAASQLMARPGMDDGERVGGAVAFVFVFAAPLVTVWFCRSRLPRMCIAYDFKQSRLYHQLYSGPIAYVMLPRSRIEPIQQRRMYSTLISSYRSPHPLVPVLPIAIPFLLTLLALWSPVGSNQCTMFFSLALSIHVVVCAAMIALRPLHLRYDLPLLVCGIVINGALLLLSILGISDPHFDMRDATFGLVVAQVVVQIVKTLLRFWSNKLEDLLENVPTYMEWSIGYGHLIADIDKVLTLDAGAEADDVEMLAIGLLDAADDNESLELHLEDEVYEAHDVVVTEDLQGQQKVPHTLELLPVIGGCDAADHAVGGDASEGLCDLTHALETLVRHDEEMRLRDELRLSAEEPAAPAHNREGLAEDATQSIGR